MALSIRGVFHYLSLVLLVWCLISASIETNIVWNGVAAAQIANRHSNNDDEAVYGDVIAIPPPSLPCFLSAKLLKGDGSGGAAELFDARLATSAICLVQRITASIDAMRVLNAPEEDSSSPFSTLSPAADALQSRLKAAENAVRQSCQRPSKAEACVSFLTQILEMLQAAMEVPKVANDSDLSASSAVIAELAAGPRMEAEEAVQLLHELVQSVLRPPSIPGRPFNSPDVAIAKAQPFQLLEAQELPEPLRLSLQEERRVFVLEDTGASATNDTAATSPTATSAILTAGVVISAAISLVFGCILLGFVVVEIIVVVITWRHQRRSGEDQSEKQLAAGEQSAAV